MSLSAWTRDSLLFGNMTDDEFAKWQGRIFSREYERRMERATYHGIRMNKWIETRTRLSLTTPGQYCFQPVSFRDRPGKKTLTTVFVLELSRMKTPSERRAGKHDGVAENILMDRNIDCCCHGTW